MSSPEMEEEEPLDPAMERVRRKLVRLLMVSSGVMVLGFVAVAIAVFYRISADRGPVEPGTVALDIAPGDLDTIALGEDTIAFQIGGARPRIEVRRIADGALVQTFQFREAGAVPE